MIIGGVIVLVALVAVVLMMQPAPEAEPIKPEPIELGVKNKTK